MALFFGTEIDLYIVQRYFCRFTDILAQKFMKQDINIIPVVQGEQAFKINESELPDVLPVLALRNAALFPGTVYPITIGREKSIRLIQDAEETVSISAPCPRRT